MNSSIFWNFVFLVIFFLLGFFLINHSFKTESNSVIKNGIVSIRGQNVNVELALTPKTQERGLSGRIALGENQGMLFIFSENGRHYFWMKDMNFPIDIIWLGGDFKVLYIEKNLAPKTYPSTYGPNQNSKFVLEVEAGFTDKNHVNIGDEVFISTPNSK